MAMIPAGTIPQELLDAFEQQLSAAFDGYGIYRIFLNEHNRIQFDRIPEEEIYEWPKAQAPVECEPDTRSENEHPPAGNSDSG